MNETEVRETQTELIVGKNHMCICVRRTHIIHIVILIVSQLDNTVGALGRE